MARLTFPSDRLVYKASSYAGSGFTSAAGSTATVYSDSAGTILADVQQLDGTANPTATFTVDTTSRLPLFLGPASGADTLYVKIDSGPVTAIYAVTSGDISAAIGTEVASRQAADAALAKPRGAWAASTAYAVNDVVTSGGAAYRCLTAHTSGASFSGAGVNWEAWAASGGSVPSATGNALRVLRVKSDESGAEWTPPSRAVVNVKFYGAKGDGVSLADGVTTSGSPTLTSALATFTSADVGKVIYVYNGSTTFSSTIQAVVDAHTVTMAANCTFTGTARNFSYCTDDNTAISAAITALGTVGEGYSKVLYFPPTVGWYGDSGQHSFDHTDNISIVGETVGSWTNDNLVQRPAADWRYLGNAAGTTSFVSAKGSVGFTLRGVALRPDSPSFAGKLLNLAGDGTRHTFKFLVDSCYIGDARNNQNNVTGVEVGATVLGTFVNTAFDYMGNQVSCADTTGGTFANVITFRDCVWSHYYLNGVYVPAGVLPTQWLFEGCTFEPGVFNTQAMSVNQGNAWSFVNTGFWDLGGNTAGWISQTGTATLKGWTFTGCYWEVNSTGYAFGLKVVDGLAVHGNKFYTPSGTGTVFKTGSTVTNMVYRGNQHENVTDNSWIAPGGVQAWYAADGTLWQDTGRSTPATADGTAVATWDDASGGANHVAQGTAANRPLLKTSIINSKPILRFDGTNDSLTLATWVSGSGAALAQPNVIFVVAKPSSGTTAVIVDAGQGQTGEHVIGVSTGTPALHQAYAGTAINSTSEQQVFAVREVVFNGTAAAMLTNGSLDAAANVGTNTMQGVTVGANVTPANFLNGDIAEVIVLHGSQWIDGEARSRVRRYLASKYALPLVAA